MWKVELHVNKVYFLLNVSGDKKPNRADVQQQKQAIAVSAGSLPLGNVLCSWEIQRNDEAVKICKRLHI